MLEVSRNLGKLGKSQNRKGLSKELASLAACPSPWPLLLCSESKAARTITTALPNRPQCKRSLTNGPPGKRNKLWKHAKSTTGKCKGSAVSLTLVHKSHRLELVESNEFVVRQWSWGSYGNWYPTSLSPGFASFAWWPLGWMAENWHCDFQWHLFRPFENVWEMSRPKDYYYSTVSQNNFQESQNQQREPKGRFTASALETGTGLLLPAPLVLLIAFSMVHWECLESISDLESRGCFRVWGSFGTLAIQLEKCSQNLIHTSTSCCHCCERHCHWRRCCSLLPLLYTAMGLHWRCCGCSGGSGGWGRLRRCGCCWRLYFWRSGFSQQATAETVQVSRPSAVS